MNLLSQFIIKKQKQEDKFLDRREQEISKLSKHRDV